MQKDFSFRHRKHREIRLESSGKSSRFRVSDAPRLDKRRLFESAPDRTIESGFSNREQTSLSANTASSEANDTTSLDDNQSHGLSTQQTEFPRGSASVRDSLPNGVHTVSYLGVFLFTFFLYFRPYEILPALSGFDSVTFLIGIVTVLSYFAIQINSEWRPFAREKEVWLVLGMLAYAIVALPIAADRSLAWNTLTETFLKVALIFACLVAVIRSRRRLDGLIFLSVAIGAKLGYDAITIYQAGKFEVEGYRIKVNLGGMFANPNDLAIHFVIFMPIAIGVAAASRSRVARILWLSAAALMIAGTLVTQSRAGFLGLIAVSLVLIWNFGRRHRVRTLLGVAAAIVLIIAIMPGNYSMRVASIFNPSLDPVGSSSQRQEALERSIIVTLRNPQGIGIGNSRVYGVRNLEFHNAYTQVSAELGWVAFGCYLLLLYLPLRRLRKIIKSADSKDGPDRWAYYYAIGITAGIVGYAVSSFFASVAYQWYLYYPIAYAIALDRIVRENTKFEEGTYAFAEGPAEYRKWS